MECLMINKRSSAPTSMFWNAAGLSIIILAVSMFRATNFKLETANNKLEVNRAVEQIKKVSDTLEKSAETLPPKKKQLVKSELEKIDADLIETQDSILSNEEYTEVK
jgi:predicted component of type VI protein secretion system